MEDNKISSGSSGQRMKSVLVRPSHSPSSATNKNKRQEKCEQQPIQQSSTNNTNTDNTSKNNKNKNKNKNKPKNNSTGQTETNTTPETTKAQETTTSHETKAEGADTQPNKNNKTSKTKKSKKKSKNLTDPAKIVEELLAKSSFKIPNLSQLVEERFYKTKEGKEELYHGTCDVSYLPTVGPVCDGSLDEYISVKPTSFQGHINLSPSAIMSLKCMNYVPAKRWVRRRKNGGNNKNNNNEKSNNGQNIKKQANSVNNKNT